MLKITTEVCGLSSPACRASCAAAAVTEKLRNQAAVYVSLWVLEFRAAWNVCDIVSTKKSNHKKRVCWGKSSRNQQWKNKHAADRWQRYVSVHWSEASRTTTRHVCVYASLCATSCQTKSFCAPSRRTQANQATTRQLCTAQIMRLHCAGFTVLVSLHKESLPIIKRSQLQIKGIVQVLLSGVAQGTHPQLECIACSLFVLLWTWDPLVTSATVC